MTDHTIEKSVVIDAPQDVVWRTVTEPDQIRRWFADRVAMEVEPGGHGSLEFDHDDGRPSHVEALVVEAVEPPSRFAYRWGYPSGATPTVENSVLVEFLLESEGPERTRLVIRESGLEHVDWADAAKSAYATEHSSGWAYFAGRLVAYLAPDGQAAPGG